MQVICFHLYNDYSGSPRVLRTVLDGLLREGVDVTLVSSRGGALDGIESHSSTSYGGKRGFRRRAASTIL